MNAAKLRELIVDLRPPRFAGMVGAGADPVGCSGREESKTEDRGGGGETMNATQMLAVERLLSVEDYALLLGMPGTMCVDSLLHRSRSIVPLTLACASPRWYDLQRSCPMRDASHVRQVI